MGSVATTAPFRFLIVGGSYSGLSSALNLIDICSGRSPRMAQDPYPHHPEFKNIPVDITIVDERDGFFHLIGGPLAFASTEYASKAWVKFADIPALQRPNIRFIQGSLDKVNQKQKSATILTHLTKIPQHVSYDFMITATGMRRPFPVVPQSLLRKQWLLEAEEHIHAVRNAPDGVVVVGGGAVGIEMAAELKEVSPSTKVTLVHSRGQLLSSEGLSDECKDKALELTREAGVDVLLNHRLASSTELPATDGARVRYEVEFTNGHKITANKVIMAISSPKPSTTFADPATLDEEGFVKIQPSLFLEPGEGVENPDSHLVVGDAAKWSGIKRCGSAMHHGHYAAYNAHQRMLAILTGDRPREEDRHVPVFKTLEYAPPVIGLAVGKKAVAYGPDMGTISGEDVMEAYFRDDLGFTICWNWMGLGKSPADEVAEAEAAAAAAAAEAKAEAAEAKVVEVTTSTVEVKA